MLYLSFTAEVRLDSSVTTLKTKGAARVWTELDDDLPPFMEQALIEAVAADMIEASHNYWQLHLNSCKLLPLKAA